jgi:TolA-binding protein
MNRQLGRTHLQSLFIAISLLGVASSVGFAEQFIHTIQLNSYFIDPAASGVSKGEALSEKRLSEWETEGYTPVFFHQEGNWRHLCYGKWGGGNQGAIKALQYAELIHASGRARNTIVRALPTNKGFSPETAVSPDSSLPDIPQVASYSVLLAGFREADNAERFLVKTQKLGFDDLTIRPKGLLSSVYYGKFSSADIAERERVQVVQSGVTDSALIVVLNEASSSNSPENTDKISNIAKVNSLTKNRRMHSLIMGQERDGLSHNQYYLVSVGGFSSSSEGQAMQKKITAKGFATHGVKAIGGKYHAGFGGFATYADALVSARRAAKAGLIEEFEILKVNEAPPNIANTERYGVSKNKGLRLGTNSYHQSGGDGVPLPSYLGVTEKPFRSNTKLSDSRRELLKSVDGAKSQLYESLVPDNSRELNLYYRQSKESLTKLGKNDGNIRSAFEDVPAKWKQGASGVAAQRVALVSSQSGDQKTARMLHQMVASGQIAAPEDVRIRAAWDAAKCLYREKDRLGALQAFNELAQHLPNAEDREQAGIERVGLLMELAESAKGSMADARSAAYAVLSQMGEPINGQAIQRQATLELMYAESFAKEGSDIDARGHLEVFIDDYADNPWVRKQVATARIWLGVVNKRLGRDDEAVSEFQSVINMSLSAEENFGGENHTARAAVWLFDHAIGEGDIETAKLWYDFLDKNFPDRGETLRARQLIIRSTK